MKKQQVPPKPETCPICHREMEDRRHVGVECFYDVKEVVPTAQEHVIFNEVDRKTAYWGITRHYPKGTRDKWFVKKRFVDKNGIKHTETGIRQVPAKPVRLLEKKIFSVACCKSCPDMPKIQADFISFPDH